MKARFFDLPLIGYLSVSIILIILLITLSWFKMVEKAYWVLISLTITSVIYILFTIGNSLYEILIDFKSINPKIPELIKTISTANDALITFLVNQCDDYIQAALIPVMTIVFGAVGYYFTLKSENHFHMLDMFLYILLSLILIVVLIEAYIRFFLKRFIAQCQFTGLFLLGEKRIIENSFQLRLVAHKLLKPQDVIGRIFILICFTLFLIFYRLFGML